MALRTTKARRKRAQILGFVVCRLLKDINPNASAEVMMFKNCKGQAIFQFPREGKLADRLREAYRYTESKEVA